MGNNVTGDEPYRENVIDQVVSGTNESFHQQRPDEVDQLCISFNKHILDDSDTGNSGNQATQKNQKTSHVQNTISSQRKTVVLVHPFTESIIKFFLSDLFEKYGMENVTYVFKERCVTIDGPDEIVRVFEKEYTSATNKLRNSLTVDFLEVGDNFDLDFQMYPDYGVCVDYIRDKKQLKFYGTKWTDIQTVKQKIRMKVDFGKHQNPAEELNHQKNVPNIIVHGDNNLQKQVARPKIKNSNIPSQNSTHSDLKKLKMTYQIKTVVVKIYMSNIIDVPVECIVNATNYSLQHFGGVARVIADAAGTELKEDCKRYIKKYSKLKVGEACTTSAGKLSYRRVIHAVGPCWSYYKPHTLSDVRRCENTILTAIKNSLFCADHFCQKVAFTAISAGQFGCPLELCAVQYGRAVLEYTSRQNHPLKEIHFVDLNQDIVCEIQKVFAVIESTGNIPAHYDSSVFVRPTAATVHTSHGREG